MAFSVQILIQKYHDNLISQFKIWIKQVGLKIIQK